jgi:hypothetical protein
VQIAEINHVSELVGKMITSAFLYDHQKIYQQKNEEKPLQ